MKDFQTNVATATNDFTNAIVNENSVKGYGKNVGLQKRQAIPAIWRILSKAKKTFTAQLSFVKNNETKLKCIEMYMTVETNDAPKFWGEFMRQVDRLLDSRKFLRECVERGYKPENVAEHIVFLGSAMINKVLNNGVLNTIGNDLKLYADRLSPADADIYRDDIIAFLKDEKVA